MIESERALRDKMMVSLEKARNSIRPLNEMAYRFNQPVFLNELRAVDNEISYLIDKIRSSPSGFDKQVSEATKFDALYVDSCELITDQIDDLYAKVLESKMNFQLFTPELFALRKMVVDMQNTYGGRLTTMTRANLIARGVQNRLKKDDLFAAKEVLEDLRVVAAEDENISRRMVSLIQAQAPHIDQQMEALKKSGLPQGKLNPILEKWAVVKKVASEIQSAKTAVHTFLDLGVLIAGIATPAFPAAMLTAKAIMGVVSRLTGG